MRRTREAEGGCVCRGARTAGDRGALGRVHLSQRDEAHKCRELRHTQPLTPSTVSRRPKLGSGEAQLLVGSRIWEECGWRKGKA